MLGFFEWLASLSSVFENSILSVVHWFLWANPPKEKKQHLGNQSTDSLRGSQQETLMFCICSHCWFVLWTQALGKYRCVEEDTDILLSTLSAMQEKAQHLEYNLSAETRIKLDLFSALGDARRQLEIAQGSQSVSEIKLMFNCEIWF